MSISMQLNIVSAEASVFSSPVRFLAVTGKIGELGIYPGHTALLTALRPGQVRVQIEDEMPEEIFYISGGILEIQPSIVTILADTALRADDLDEAAAQAAEQRAHKILSEKKAGIEYSRALIELAEAAAQLRTIATLRKYSRHSAHRGKHSDSVL